MTNLIEFYIPTRYKSKKHFVPLEMRGRILEFPAYRATVVLIDKALEALKQI